MNTLAPAAPRARLNPFAFPSETDLRFVLLILAVVGTSLTFYLIIFNNLPGNPQWLARLSDECFAQFRQTTTIEEGAVVFSACFAPYERPAGGWMLGGTALLLGLAALLYWVHPWWKLRRGGLTPLTAADLPEVHADLLGLCRETGLARPPQFVWNALDGRSGALAFGRWGRYYLALRGGLVAQFYTDRPAFRAIMLHELAHLRHRDVDKTYFAVAVGQAFWVAALAPLILAFLFGWIQRGSDPNQAADAWLAFHLAWRVAALTAVVYLTRAAVLRVREYYADVQAATWEGAGGALRRILAGLPVEAARWWQAAWRVHPAPSHRRQVVDDPAPLFRASFADVTLAGLVAGLAFPNIISLLSALLPRDQAFTADFWALLLGPVPAVAVAGLGIWRARFAAAVLGTPPPPSGRLGLGFGLGLLAGELLALRSAATAPYDPLAGVPGAAIAQYTPQNVEFPLGFALGWGVLLLASLFVLFRWIGAVAATWVAAMMNHTYSRRVPVVGLVLAAGVVAAWLGVLMIIRLGGPEVIATPFVLLIPVFFTTQPLALLALASLWAFPLASWLWQRRARAAAPSWMYLDPLAAPPAVPAPIPLRLRVALVGGGLGGLLCVVVLIFLRVGVRLLLPEDVRADAGFSLFFYALNILAIFLIQALVAAGVAAAVPRLGTIQGLFAAFVTGCLATIVMLGLVVVAPCIPILKLSSLVRDCGAPLDPTFPAFAANTFLLIVNGGALLALVVGGGVAALAEWARRPPPGPAPRPAAHTL